MTTKDLQLLRSYIRNTMDDCSSLSVEEVEHLVRTIDSELHRAHVADFISMLEAAMPATDAPVDKIDAFYDSTFTISYGNYSVTLVMTATIYNGLLEVLEAYLNDCL